MINACSFRPVYCKTPIDDLKSLLGGWFVSDGYLVVKCLRCGSISQLQMAAVRSDVSLCPVCTESEIECIAVQCTMQVCPENSKEIPKSNPFLSTLARFSIN